MTNDKTINQRVRELRIARNIKQQKIADFLGMKFSTYSQMEREGNISAEKLKHIAKFFKVDYEFLIDGENSDLQSKYDAVRQEIEEQYRKKYGFLEAFSDAELKHIKMISYLSKAKRKSVYKYAYKLFKNEIKSD